MNFIKNLLKYIYLNFFLRKNLTVDFNTNLDTNSTYGKDGVFAKGVLVGNSKIGTSVIVKENSVIKRSELADFICVHQNCKITASSIGSFTYIAKLSEISAATIGKFCSIGPEVLVGLGKHPANFISTSPVFYSSSKKQLGFSFTDKQLFEEYNTCTIGNDVWIGARVMILDGIIIGDGAIVAANSVVTKDVEPYSIVGGSPAKHIKYRFDENKIKELLQMKWWDWPKEKLKESLHLFQKEITD